MNLNDILPLQPWEVPNDVWKGMQELFPSISNPIGYKTYYESYEYKIIGFDLHGFKEWFFYIGDDHTAHNYNKILFNHPPLKIIATVTDLYLKDALQGFNIRISFPKRMKPIYQIIVNDLFLKYSSRGEYEKKYIENTFGELDSIEVTRKEK